MKKLLTILLMIGLMCSLIGCAAVNKKENGSVIEHSTETDDSEIKDSDDETKEEGKIHRKNELSFEFSVNGGKWSLPCTLNDILNATNYKISEEDNHGMLSEDGYEGTNIDISNNENVELFYVSIYKWDGKIPYRNAKVGHIYQLLYNIEDGAEPIVFPGNFIVGQKLTEKKLIDILGKYTKKNEFITSDDVEYTYEYGDLYHYVITITDEGVIESLSVSIDEYAADME